MLRFTRLRSTVPAAVLAGVVLLPAPSRAVEDPVCLAVSVTPPGGEPLGVLPPHCVLVPLTTFCREVKVPVGGLSVTVFECLPM
jgi:hypothetical protein